ncbi:hypothetical protein WMY93_015442 [Mugilogobius chulae]|uniref:NBAS subunit of NRZ tethering complex C-terminal domain-containing protein n=1 Tax=Mugilogobius chulae TaxID=88201 RepID=A0AAW0NQJ9_9GOBI
MSHKSGAQKRKIQREKEHRESLLLQKIPKLTGYFKTSSSETAVSAESQETTTPAALSSDDDADDFESQRESLFQGTVTSSPDSESSNLQPAPEPPPPPTAFAAYTSTDPGCWGELTEDAINYWMMRTKTSAHAGKLSLYDNRWKSSKQTSAMLQEVDLDLSTAVELVGSLRQFIASLRDEFDKFETTAKNLSPNVVKKRSDESQVEDEIIMTGRQNFVINVFYVDTKCRWHICLLFFQLLKVEVMHRFTHRFKTFMNEALRMRVNPVYMLSVITWNIPIQTANLKKINWASFLIYWAGFELSLGLPGPRKIFSLDLATLGTGLLGRGLLMQSTDQITASYTVLPNYCFDILAYFHQEKQHLKRVRYRQKERESERERGPAHTAAAVCDVIHHTGWPERTLCVCVSTCFRSFCYKLCSQNYLNIKITGYFYEMLPAGKAASQNVSICLQSGALAPVRSGVRPKFETNETYSERRIGRTGDTGLDFCSSLVTPAPLSVSPYPLLKDTKLNFMTMEKSHETVQYVCAQYRDSLISRDLAIIQTYVNPSYLSCMQTNKITNLKIEQVGRVLLWSSKNARMLQVIYSSLFCTYNHFLLVLAFRYNHASLICKSPKLQILDSDHLPGRDNPSFKVKGARVLGSTADWSRAGATSREGACENSNLQRQGCSPFYQDLIDDPYVDPSQDVYSSYKVVLQEDFAEVLLRTGKLAEAKTEGQTLFPATEVLLQLANDAFPRDMMLALSYLLALPQVLDANKCFEKQCHSALSLQLAAYYYSLQIYSRLAPCFKDKNHTLYQADPKEMIRLVTQHVSSYSGWPQELQKLIEQLQMYNERLMDFTQAQVLQGLGRGVDVSRFSSDADYKKETILGLTETLDEGVYKIALSLAKRYSVPLWEVYMTHLEFLFTDSGLSTKDIESRSDSLGLFDTLKSDPEAFHSHMNKYVLPSVEATDMGRLLYYYTLLDAAGCHPYVSTAIKPDSHVKLLKKLRAVASGLDYRKLTDESRNPLLTLEPVLTSQNVLSISKLATRLPMPGEQGQTVSPSAVHSVWLKKLFWKGDPQLLKRAPQNDQDYLHAYDTCAKYLDRLVPSDAVDFLDNITFSHDAAEHLSISARSEVIKRATKALRQLAEKSRKRGSGEQEEKDPAGRSFDEALSHLQQSQSHMETLSQPCIMSLRDSQQEQLQGYSRLYDLSRSERTKVHELAVTMATDGHPLEQIGEVLRAAVGQLDLSVKTVLHDAVERVVSALSGDSDALTKYPQPLMVLESMVTAVHRSVQSGAATERNPWVVLTSALLTHHQSSEGALDIGQQVVSMVRSLYSTKHKLPAQDAASGCDPELLSLLLDAGLLVGCVSSPLYPLLSSHMLSHQSEGGWDVEAAASALLSAGHAAEAGSLLLAHRGTHQSHFTFNTALAVLKKWL